MAFKVGSQTVIDLDLGGATQLQSAVGKDIALYPSENIWIKEGTKLVFEGTLPDSFEAKLQATTLTADRDIILPDSDGTLTTETFVNDISGALTIYIDNEIASNTGTNLNLSQTDTDALSEGTTNLYYTDARVDARISSQISGNLDLSSKDTDELAEGSNNLYYTDARAQNALASTVSTILSDITTGDASTLSSAKVYADFRDTTLIGDSTVDGTIGNTVKNRIDSAESSAKVYADFRDTTLIGDSTVDGTIGNTVKNRIDSAEADAKTYTDTQIANVSGGSLDLSSKDTDDLAEGSTNLYYTTARSNTDFDSRLAVKSTDHVSEGGNLYYTDARVNTLLATKGYATTLYADNAEADAKVYTDAQIINVTAGNLNLSSKDTDDLSEGSTNLYYTNARADARADVRIAASTTDNISEGGNLYYTNARVDALLATKGYATTLYADNAEADAKAYTDTQIASVSGGSLDLSNKDTDDLSEGSSNLYYTDARADARITSALGGNVVIGGDLTVQGTNFIVDSNTVNIGDNIINLNADETGAPSQNAGIEVTRGTSPTVKFIWDETNDKWTTDGKTLTAGSFEGNVSGTVSSLSNHDTADLSEGTNLYFTNARADARADARIAAADTDDLSEGSTNLYYTDDRVFTKTSNIIKAGSRMSISADPATQEITFIATDQFPSHTSDNLTEGTSNLYYTTARVNTDFDSRLAVKSTDNLSEGGNLYYTNARVNALLATKGYITNDTNSYLNSASFNTADGVVTLGRTDGGSVTVDLDGRYSTTDTNTTYSAGTGMSLSGTTFNCTIDSPSEVGLSNLSSNGNNLAGSFTATGDITAYSDRRFKHNIVTVDNALDKVTQLRGVSYEKDGRESLGVIAQEVEEIIPQVVHTDAEGMKSVAYGNIVGVLIEAIKEQQKLITQLQEEVKNIKK